MAIEFRIHHLEDVESTNRVARELVLDGAGEDLVVVAGTQSKGRGRLDRSWESPEGGLWFSIILRPDIEPDMVPSLNIIGALSVARVLRNDYDMDARVKWPNDVRVEGRKICGILSEMFRGRSGDMFLVIGIGLNANIDVSCFSKDIRVRTTSIKNERGVEVDLDTLLNSILTQFGTLCSDMFSGGFPAVLSEHRSLVESIGSRVRVRPVPPEEAFEGIAVGMDRRGALVVELDDGRNRCVLEGDVDLV